MPAATKKRIKIKPFRQPPKLPPDFYETTSKELLEATSSILSSQQRLHSGGSGNSGGSNDSKTSASLQSCYNAVVNLVSHQYGPRLYQDLLKELQRSTKLILNASESSTTTTKPTLEFLSVQYPKFVSYLLIVRHIFLALDRPYVVVWMDDSNNNNNSNVNTTTTTSSSSSEQFRVIKRTSQTTTLLEVGLSLLAQRLSALEWDPVLYEQWWGLLWDSFLTESTDPLLSTTMSIWKDLGVARRTISQTQPRFQHALTQLSNEWKSKKTATTSLGGASYPAEDFLALTHRKWCFVGNSWGTFLPKPWLRSMLERYLLEPHLHPDYLLRNLDITNIPHCQKLWQLAHRVVRTSSASNSTATTATAGDAQQQQEPESGMTLVLDAVCQLVRQEGLKYVNAAVGGGNTHSNSNNNNNGASAGGGSSGSGNPKQQVICNLLRLHSQLQTLSHHVGEIPLKSVWSEILNTTPLVAEWLAKFIDLEFRNNHKKSSSSLKNIHNNNNNELDPLLFLFQHLSAKDIFEAFYKKDLAKRLLSNKIHSMDLERQFVSLLKAECGAGYTSKMEGMFQDMDWSRESLARYKSSPEYRESLRQQQSSNSEEGAVGAVDMEVQILTTGYWPVYPQYPHLVLPEELLQRQDHFWNYYKQKYQGRKIAWQHALGTCLIKYYSRSNNSNKTYELVVSLCQGLTLLCFNERPVWSFAELAQRIGLSDRDEMERVLASLSMGRDHARVLKKLEPVSGGGSANHKSKKMPMTASDTDMFGINESFHSPMRRIRIGNLLRKETKEERDKVVEGVSRDRLYMIDAVLVRILKARKTIYHQQLIPQVLDQIKVPAQPADIKKRIESLIEREYMERDEKERNRYNYLA